jgi:hypothetical protein
LLGFPGRGVGDGARAKKRAEVQPSALLYRYLYSDRDE